MSLRRKLPPNTRNSSTDYGENMQGSNVELFAMHIRRSRSLTFVLRSQAEGELVAGHCLFVDFQANGMSYQTSDSEDFEEKYTSKSDKDDPKKQESVVLQNCERPREYPK